MPLKGPARRTSAPPSLIRERLRLLDGRDEGSERLNAEFQGLVETVLSIYVNSWYSPLTPRERTLIPHLNATIFSLSHSLLSALDPSDASHLVLIRLPTILAHHVRLFHLARGQAGTSLVQQGHDTADSPASAVAVAYHGLANHLGVTLSASADRPPFVASPIYLGIMARQLLHAHLPAEDAGSEVEMSLLQDMLARAVLENTLGKLGEPWFIWTMALVLLEDTGSASGDDPARSGAASLPQVTLRWMSLIASLLMGLVDLLLSTFRAWTSPAKESKPDRWQHVLDPWVLLGEALLRPADGCATAGGAWGMVHAASIILGPAADSAIPPLVQHSILQPDVFATCIHKLHTTLFPNGQSAPSVPPPSPSETILLRKRLERAIMARTPPAARWLLLGRSEGEQRRRVSELMEPFGNAAVNAHLMIVLLDAVAGLVLKPVL